MKNLKLATIKITLTYLSASPGGRRQEVRRSTPGGASIGLCQHQWSPANVFCNIEDHRHLSLKVLYVEFDINVPLRQQYIENLMSKIYDVELLICRLL